MPAIVTDDLVELRVNYVQNGQRLMNVFHYRATDVSTDLDYETALQFAMSEFLENPDMWVSKWDDNATEECSIYKVEIQRIFPDRTYHLSQLVDVPGTVPVATFVPLPQNSQLSLTKVTTASGRGRTGRIEVPGGTAELVEEGRLNADGIVWMNQLADAIQLPIPLEELNPSALQPIVLYGFAPAGSPAIEMVRVQDTVRVSRRRTVGVGE